MTSLNAIINIFFSEKSMEILFDKGKGEIFSTSLSWLDSKEEHLQLSGALAVGNFARSGKYFMHCFKETEVFYLMQIVS